MLEETMTARRKVVIDSFPESVARYSGSHAIVCIDVLTAATTLVTSLARGRRVFVASSTADAFALAAGLGGCESVDSPAMAAKTGALDRPLVLCDSPGSELIAAAAAQQPNSIWVCSLRNLEATARSLAAKARHVAIIGAGYHSEFSSEDQFGCGKLAYRLMELGYALSDLRSMEIVKRWRDAEPSILAWGNSAAALRKAGRCEDVDFVLAHYDDLAFASRCQKSGEITIEIHEASEPQRPLRQNASAEAGKSVKGAY